MNKRKILIIDDDADVVMVVRSRLEAQGYEVVTAYSGDAGIEEIKNENPDIIVLDVVLPGRNGYEVCAKIKADKELSRPVIMLTSRNKEVDKQMGFICKADAYVIKPRSGEDLLPHIERLINREACGKGEVS